MRPGPSWTFFGRPTEEPIEVQLRMLATDGIGGGPGIDGRAWVSIGPIVDGAPGRASLGPLPLELRVRSIREDPGGGLAVATVKVAADELGPDAAGVWVLVERRGPTGAVIPVHLATARDAVTVTGLAPFPAAEGTPAG